MSEVEAAGAQLLVRSTGSESAAVDPWPAVFPATPTDHDVLAVTVRGSPARWLRRWQTHLPDRPARLGIVCADGITRSASGASGTKQDLPGDISMRAVAGPGDLTGLGIAVSEYLSEWAGRETRPLVYFDSVTTLLQYAAVERVTKFLHVLSRRVETANGGIYFHLDPEAHSDQTVATLRAMVDGVVTPD